MEVIFSTKAKQDLQDIGDFIAADSPRRAVTFVLDRQKSCVELAEYPLRFPQIEWYGTGQHRRRVHGNYLIIYRVDGSAVNIVRVISASVDVRSLGESD